MLSIKSSRRTLFPFFICLLSLFLTSCNLFGGNPPTKPLVKAPASKQVYTIPEIGLSNLDTLDPALAHDTASLNAVQLLYTGLVAYDDKLQIRPQLATWDVSADGLTWTFHLKPNLKFSDGMPLTSADVAFSLDRALQPATQSTVAPIYLRLIKDADQLLAGHISTLIGDSLQTPDPSTLIIVLSKPAAYFLAMLTSACADVVEKSMVSTYGTNFTQHLTQGGTSGPFKLARYISGKEVDLVPNTDYYDAKPQLQKVVLAFYHSASDAYQAYQAGRVDMTAVPLANFANDQKRSDFHQVPLLWTNYYSMNYLTKPFDSIHIRQAFDLAINKQAIASSVWHNTVLPTNHIVPQGLPGYNPQLTAPDGSHTLTGNIQQAQKLLKLGLQDEGLTNVTQLPPITLTYASNVPNFTQEVTALIQTWKQVLGITVTPNPVDYNTLLDQVTAATNNAQGIQFWGLAWISEYPDMEDWLTLQFDRGVPNNNMNYGQNQSSDNAQQQTIQQQLEVADATTQAQTRIQLYQKAEQQLVNDVAWLPLEQVTNIFLRTPYIHGIVDNGQGNIPPDDWASIYRLQPA